MKDKIKEILNDKFGFFAVLGGERMYNGKFDPSVNVNSVAECIESYINSHYIAKEKVKGLTEDAWHYWRECPRCGYGGNNYLHCMHDGIQSSCTMCGEKLPTIKGECSCEFVMTHEEINKSIDLMVEDNKTLRVWNTSGNISYTTQDIDKLKKEGLLTETKPTQQDSVISSESED